MTFRELRWLPPGRHFVWLPRCVAISTGPGEPYDRAWIWLRWAIFLDVRVHFSPPLQAIEP